MAARRTSPDALLRSLATDAIAPVYLFHGEEQYLIEQAVSTIVARVAGDVPSSFDVDMVSFADMTPAEIFARASAYPMSAEKRVVVARDLDRVLGKPVKGAEESPREGENKGAALGPMLDYLARPLQTTCVVLTASKTLDGRLKPVKDLQDRGAAYEFTPLYESEVTSWIAHRVQTAGHTIDDDACQLLATYVGQSLFDVSSEIEKLLIYTAGKHSITAEDVAALVGVSREHNIWELQRAVGGKDLRKSLTILEHMMDESQSGPYLTVMLTGYFARLWKLHALLHRLRDERKVMEEMQVAPFVFRELRTACENYPTLEVGNAIRVLLEADVRLKTGALEERSTLDAMIVQIIGGGVV
jgi:DNA polymerase III subunit delta